MYCAVGKNSEILIAGLIVVGSLLNLKLSVDHSSSYSPRICIRLQLKKLTFAGAMKKKTVQYIDHSNWASRKQKSWFTVVTEFN